MATRPAQAAKRGRTRRDTAKHGETRPKAAKPTRRALLQRIGRYKKQLWWANGEIERLRPNRVQQDLDDLRDAAQTAMDQYLSEQACRVANQNAVTQIMEELKAVERERKELRAGTGTTTMKRNSIDSAGVMCADLIEQIEKMSTAPALWPQDWRSLRGYADAISLYLERLQAQNAVLERRVLSVQSIDEEINKRMQEEQAKTLLPPPK